MISRFLEEVCRSSGTFSESCLEVKNDSEDNKVTCVRTKEPELACKGYRRISWALQLILFNAVVFVPTVSGE